MSAQLPEQEVYNCAGCGGAIITLWAPDGGGLLRGDYELIGDTIWHPDCWDRHVALLWGKQGESACGP